MQRDRTFKLLRGELPKFRIILARGVIKEPAVCKSILFKLLSFLDVTRHASNRLEKLYFDPA